MSRSPCIRSGQSDSSDPAGWKAHDPYYGLSLGMYSNGHRVSIYAQQSPAGHIYKHTCWHIFGSHSPKVAQTHCQCATGEGSHIRPPTPTLHGGPILTYPQGVTLRPGVGHLGVQGVQQASTHLPPGSQWVSKPSAWCSRPGHTSPTRPRLVDV